MVGEGFIYTLVDGLVVFATDLLIPFMLFAFVVGVALRFLIFYTIKREDWFAREFDKRVVRFIDSNPQGDHLSFYVLVKTLLEKTFYEAFEKRAIMKRRRMDYLNDPIDRTFLIQHGCAHLVRDTLKQIKYLRFENHTPKFLEISKNVFENNACFKRLMGVVPISLVNDVLGILPGIFIIGGIFGTFLGIMKALPDLGQMDLNDVEGTKLVMDAFLLKISFSMSTSIVGILLSVGMTIVNTLMYPEKVFVDVVNRFEITMGALWNRSHNNRLPEEIPEFDEHRDPIEALAELSVRNELDGKNKKRKGSGVRNPDLDKQEKDKEEVEEAS